MTKGDEKKLDVFQTKCLRKIVKIICERHVRNEAVLERAVLKNMRDELHRNTEEDGSTSAVS